MIRMDARQEKVAEEVTKMIQTGPSKVRKITLYGMGRYFKALKTFGPGSPVAKEALKSIKEMLKIQRIEEKLLLFILDNLESFNISATEEAVLRLYKLNENTYITYNGILDRIDEACIEKDQNKQLRPEQGVSSLLTNNRYKTMVLGLTNTFEDIKPYLPYEEEFWEYIKPKVRFLDTNGEGARHECGFRIVHDENNILCDIPIIMVPRVVDYETAMEAIRLYKRAHYLYTCLGKDMKEIQATNANEEQMQYRENIEKEANRRFR